jgi:hypothetical protein
VRGRYCIAYPITLRLNAGEIRQRAKQERPVVFWFLLGKNINPYILFLTDKSVSFLDENVNKGKKIQRI